MADSVVTQETSDMDPYLRRMALELAVKTGCNSVETVLKAAALYLEFLRVGRAT